MIVVQFPLSLVLCTGKIIVSCKLIETSVQCTGTSSNQPTHLFLFHHGFTTFGHWALRFSCSAQHVVDLIPSINGWLIHTLNLGGQLQIDYNSLWLANTQVHTIPGRGRVSSEFVWLFHHGFGPEHWQDSNDSTFEILALKLGPSKA